MSDAANSFNFGEGSLQPNIYSIIAQNESSGGVNLFGPQTSSGQAQGLYQITTGTWSQFAPQAGIDLAEFPTPNSASFAQQQQVASVIPLNRWASSTVNAVLAAFPALDTSQTIGAIATSQGSSVVPEGPGNPEGFGSNGADNSNLPPGAYYVAPEGPYVIPDAPPGVNPPPGVSPMDASTVAALGGSSGKALDLGIQIPFANDIAKWVNNAITAFDDAAAAWLGSIENLAERAFIILIGIVVIGAALLWMAKDAGILPNIGVMI